MQTARGISITPVRSAFLRSPASLMRVWCKAKALDVAGKGGPSSCFGGAEGGMVNVSDLVPLLPDLLLEASQLSNGLLLVSPELRHEELVLGIGFGVSNWNFDAHTPLLVVQ